MRNQAYFLQLPEHTQCSCTARSERIFQLVGNLIAGLAYPSKMEDLVLLVDTSQIDDFISYRLRLDLQVTVGYGPQITQHHGAAG